MSLEDAYSYSSPSAEQRIRETAGEGPSTLQTLFINPRPREAKDRGREGRRRTVVEKEEEGLRASALPSAGGREGGRRGDRGRHYEIITNRNNKRTR